MGKKKCPECEKCLPEWLEAFGDLISLLLCFFVLLLSMSSMDAKKVSEAIGSLAGAMSVLEGGTKTEISKQRIQESTPIESQDETSSEVNKVAEAAVMDANEMMEKGHGPSIAIEDAQDGFVIQLPSALLFKPGSAKIENDDALLFLKRIALIVDQLPNSVEVSVRGHTDNAVPADDSPYKDNWELSSARAIAVLSELQIDGVDPARMHAAGFSMYQPLATNATKKGRERNRRVELHFFGTKTEKQKAMKETILDKAAAPK